MSCMNLKYSQKLVNSLYSFFNEMMLGTTAFSNVRVESEVGKIKDKVKDPKPSSAAGNYT